MVHPYNKIWYTNNVVVTKMRSSQRQRWYSQSTSVGSWSSEKDTNRWGGDRINVHGGLRIHQYQLHHQIEEGQHAVTSTDTTNNKNKNESYVIGTPIHGRKPGDMVPPAPPVQQSDLDALEEFLVSHARKKGSILVDGMHMRGVCVITGAGVSTESHVPDYRSPNGAYSTGFKPMTHQQFMASEENRSRYWSRSYAGWERFSKTMPSAPHAALAQLQSMGYVNHIITQNVDRLHHKAGSDPAKVLELHGTTHRVICMHCHALYPRELVQEWLTERNPDAARSIAALAIDAKDETRRMLRAGTSAPVSSNFREDAAATPVMQRPDGDVELQQSSSSRAFQVPSCPTCSTGILKPDVVFFGDNLPKERQEQSIKIASNASGILVVGSSLAVWSAFRLVKAAKDRGTEVAIINVGETRADSLADVRVHAIAGEALGRLSRSPTLLVPQ